MGEMYITKAPCSRFAIPPHSFYVPVLETFQVTPRELNEGGNRLQGARGRDCRFANPTAWYQ